jgi:hypothetical protein
MSGAPSPPSDEKLHAQVTDFEEHMQAAQEAPLGTAQQVQTTLSLPHIIRMGIINVLILTELCVAMYMASTNPEEFTSVFFKVLFSLLVPTLILGYYSKRFIPPPKENK